MKNVCYSKEIRREFVRFSSTKNVQALELKSEVGQKVPVFAGPAKGGVNSAKQSLYFPPEFIGLLHRVVLRNDNSLFLGQPRIEVMGSVVNQSQNKTVTNEDE
jgi:hypothetical protein